MFQNINEDTVDYDSKITSENKSKVNIFANVFTKDNIVLYLISFMLSFVGLGGEFSIFSIKLEYLYLELLHFLLLVIS